MRKTNLDVGFVFAEDLGVNDFDSVALSDDAISATDSQVANTELMAIMADKNRENFVKQYPLAVAKAMVLPASQCTLGDLAIKLGNLGHNTKSKKFAKLDNPFSGINKSNALEAIKAIDVAKEVMWGRFGNTSSISALYKLNLLNWHWANGNSEFWKFGLKLKEHADAVTLLYDCKMAGNTKALSTFYSSFAKHLMMDAGFSSPNALQIRGIAAAFYAETRGDVSLFNSMANQNLDFISATTAYAYGLQQRLNSRLIGYHIWACQYLNSKGFDIFTVPAAILASPILSRYFESYYLSNDQYAKNLFEKYMKQTASGSMSSIKLSSGRVFRAPGYTANDYATGAALHFLQGIDPSGSAGADYGSNWKAKEKNRMFNNLNK